MWFGGQGPLVWGELNEEVGFELVILHNKTFINQVLTSSVERLVFPNSKASWMSVFFLIVF